MPRAVLSGRASFVDVRPDPGGQAFGRRRCAHRRTDAGRAEAGLENIAGEPAFQQSAGFLGGKWLGNLDSNQD